MTDGDRVVVTVCGSEVQARVLTAQLTARGIQAVASPTPGGGPLQEGRYEVLVASHAVEEARAVVASLAGSSAIGLLDMRRLLPALAALAILILTIVGLVQLLV